MADQAAESPGERTAFVFCGGAGLGAVQLGMLRALVERGIRPDMVTGTSSGSLNAIVYAADPSLEAVDRLERLWLSARRRDLFRINPWRIGRGLMGSAPALASDVPLRRLLRTSLPVRRIEDTAIPVAIALSDVATRRPVVMRAGDATEILLASSAVPGLYPSVTIDGREYIDGGLAADPPIGPAVEMGATRVYVLPVGWPIAEPHGGNAVMRIADAADWLCWRIAEFEVERWSARCRIDLLPSPSTRGISPFGLRATRRLIDEAYALTDAWLADSDAPAVVVDAVPARGRVAGIARGGRRLAGRLRRG
jgi:NTE family protein